MVSCPYCASQTLRKNGQNTHNGEQRYLCKTCGRNFSESSRPRAKPATPGVTVVQCAYCQRETTNPRFCSKSCSTKYNNRAFPKRVRQERHCKHCGVVIPPRRTVCDACNPSLVDWNQRTLKSLREAVTYQAHAKVRDIARYNYEKADLPRVCANCGYSKHVEICHIQPINSFPDETPVAVINALSNLVALCPNCHWELDHGLLVLSPV